jgi:hypothetical protein
MTNQRFVGSLAAVLLLLLASLSAATTREYLAQAADVPQIDSITVGGTWAQADTASVTIGNSTLTVTLGSDTTTTAQVASAVSNAINAPTIDGSKIGKELRNAAGQLIGEFRDVEAVIHPDDVDVVLVRSKVAGQPFGTPAGGDMTVAEVSTSGTIARASVQAATGRKWWSNTANWTGGTLPVTGDDLVFHEGDYGPQYGLPAGSWQPASVTVDANLGTSYAIGLPDWNRANTLGYREYRQVEVEFNNDHTAATLYTIGRGAGTCAQLMRFTHTGTAVDQIKGIVYKTGTASGTSHALYFTCGATNEGALKILRGSVALAAAQGDTASFGTPSTNGLEIGYVSSVTADSDVLVGAGCDVNDTMVIVSGGAVELRADVADSAGASLLKVLGTGTVVTVAGDGTAASPVLSHVKIQHGATITILSEATIEDDLTIEGTLDLRKGNGPITVGGSAALEIRSSGLIDDPANRLPVSSFNSVMSGGGSGS